MYIINTMIEGALVVDCRRMMMNKTMMNSIDDIHYNNNSSNSNDVDNDSNCLRDSSDSNKSFSFLTMVVVPM